MDASIAQRRCSLTRVMTCVLVLCAVWSLTGCAATGAKADRSQASSDSRFKDLLSLKKKPREIIDPEAGMDEYDAAMVMFEQKQYDEAAKKFKEIAKKFYDYPVEEDALFMVAESRYAAKRYGWAQDSYDGLIKKFPSTRYLEKSCRRLYAIGAIWLNGEENTDTKELVQVSATDVTDPDAVQRKPVPNSTPLVPNLFDKSRPLFDTPGNALKALKSVWMNDPLGPLADDALMLTAVYHIRKGRMNDADYYLDYLRREYPKSEHTQTAFVVGSHIKLASYQGARYDGRSLVDADDLIHSTLNLYPDLAERKELEAELVKIRDRGAERAWSRAEYYNRRGKPQSEAIYCETLLKEFPDTRYAEMAAKRLQELGPEYWTGMLDRYPGEHSVDGAGSRPRQTPASTRDTKSGGNSAGRETPRAIPPGRSQTPPARIVEPENEFEEMPSEDTFEDETPTNSPAREPELADDAFEAFEGTTRRASGNSFEDESAGRATP